MISDVKTQTDIAAAPVFSLCLKHLVLAPVSVVFGHLLPMCGKYQPREKNFVTRDKHE